MRTQLPIARCLAGACLVAAGLVPTATAQTATDAIDITRSIIQTERKTIVAKSLELTAGESQAFWPVYNDYWAAMNKVGDTEAKLILDFVENYDTMANEKALAILEAYLQNEEDRVTLQRSYVPKFNKVLPEKKVLRYYQIENKMDAIVDVELSRQIPLIR